MNYTVKYLSLFRIRFINSLQYRTAAFAGLFTNLVWGWMLVLAFAAFYRTAPEAFPMTFAQTVTYIWLQQMIFIMVAVFLNDYDIVESIRDGAIAYEMVRPVDIYNKWFFQLIAIRLSSMLLRGVPTIIVAVFLPYPFGPSLPPDVFHFIGFLISIILTLCVVISFTLLMYITAFYTMVFTGVQLVAIGLFFFLSGAIIPLPFFPESVQTVVQLLPFAAMHDIPLRIFSGHITGVGIIHSIGLQFFWVCFLLLTGRIVMANALKRVIVQGG